VKDVNLRRQLTAFFGGDIGFSKELTEAVELSLPAGAVIADPLLEGAESVGIEAAGADAAELFGVDQADLFENLQMLADCSESDSQRLREMRDRHRAIDEAVEHGAAGGITESVEKTLEIDLVARCHFEVGGF
jgi:hypothetical protein